MLGKYKKLDKSSSPLPTTDARSQLLKSASKLFAKKGFNGVTVREIASRARVNLSLVSYYFEGKEGLYRACLSEFGQARLEACERLLQPAATREELRLRLRLVVEEMLRV